MQRVKSIAVESRQLHRQNAHTEDYMPRKHTEGKPYIFLKEFALNCSCVCSQGAVATISDHEYSQQGLPQ